MDKSRRRSPMNRPFSLLPILVVLLCAFARTGAQQAAQPADVPFAPTASITGEMQKAMALVTTPITIFCGDTLLGSATGFFFSSADQSRLFLITNRHVVVNDHPQPGQPGPQFPDHLVLRLHQNDNDLRQSPFPVQRMTDELIATHDRRWICAACTAYLLTGY